MSWYSVIALNFGSVWGYLAGRAYQRGEWPWVGVWSVSALYCLLLAALLAWSALQ